MPTQETLAEDVAYHLCQFTKKYNWSSLQEYPAEHRPILYKKLIEHLIKISFWYRLDCLHRSDRTIFREAMEMLPDNPFKNILEICVKYNFNENLLISTFATFGHLDYQNALIAAAAVKKQSKHGSSFTPIIMQYFEVTTFLAAITANLAAALNKKFTFLVVEEGHWFTGEILLTDKNVRLFIIDSLGAPKVRNSYVYKPIIRFLQENFANKFFIQCSELCAQHSGSTCQMFAFDYLRKLNRMPESFAKLPNPTAAEETVILPLKLMRSAQLNDLAEQTKQHPQYDPTELINKKGQTIDEAVNAHIVAEVVKGKERLSNRYLEHKHTMLFQKAITYLSETNPQQQQQDIQEFTVEAFAHRISQRNLARPGMQ